MKKTTPDSSRSAARSLRILLAGLACLSSACGPSRKESTGSKAGGYPGYTLVQQLVSKTTNLIDSEGRVVHQWVSNTGLGGGTYLLENGNLLRSSLSVPSGQQSVTPGVSGIIELLDWDGNQLWSFTRGEEHNCLHHDIEPLPNGNILMLTLEQLTIQEQIALGRDPAHATDVLKLDCILEIKPEGKEGGQIVWEWHLKDHLIQDFDKTKMNFGTVSDHPEKVDINFIEALRKMSSSNLRVLQSLGYVSSTATITPQRGPPTWSHCNAVDYNPRLDQILLSMRDLNEIWVIDHGTTAAEAATGTGGKMKKGGDLLYRWGNPQSYQSGSPADQQLYGQHDAQWIKAGLPGEGNILIFNNGEGRKESQFSTIEEIKPPLRSDGSYEWTAGEGYGPAKPIWHYEAKNKQDFSSAFLSGVQRLPNGNTLICSGVQGNVFEIDASGEIVWSHHMDVNAGMGRSRPNQRPGMAGPGGRRPGPGGRPGMMRPGMRGGNGPAEGQGAAMAQDPAAKNESGFTAAEMALLTGNPLQPPTGFSGPGGGGAPGRGTGPGVPGAGGLFRATRYALDHPAFKGRKLEPLPPLPAQPPRPGGGQGAGGPGGAGGRGK